MARAALFLQHVKNGKEALAADPRLEERLGELLGAARVAWPDVALDDDTFLQHLAERLPEEGDAVAALGAVHGPDLFLACACLGGDPRALAAFDRHFLSEVASFLGRADALAGFTDEVKQALRTRLLLTDGDILPRIGRYNGRGPLGGWLRMVATRVAVDLRRERASEDSPIADAELLPSAAPDPELDYLKTRYRHELEEAFRATLAGLAARDSNILRLHFLDGLPAEAIGVMYKVSGRTVQRWLADLREQILARTRELLTEKLRVSTAELDSLMVLVQSQVQLNMRDILRKRR